MFGGRGGGLWSSLLYGIIYLWLISDIWHNIPPGF